MAYKEVEKWGYLGSFDANFQLTFSLFEWENIRDEVPSTSVFCCNMELDCLVCVRARAMATAQ
jgi:hypothetical protein